MVGALLFDMDATLAETERDGHRRAYNAAFDQPGSGVVDLALLRTWLATAHRTAP